MLMSQPKCPSKPCTLQLNKYATLTDLTEPYKRQNANYISKWERSISHPHNFSLISGLHLSTVWCNLSGLIKHGWYTCAALHKAVEMESSQMAFIVNPASKRLPATTAAWVTRPLVVIWKRSRVIVKIFSFSSYNRTRATSWIQYLFYSIDMWFGHVRGWGSLI